MQCLNVKCQSIAVVTPAWQITLDIELSSLAREELGTDSRDLGYGCGAVEQS